MYRVLGVRVDAVQIPGVIARMEEWIAARDRCRFIAVIDMHSVMEAWHAASFKKMLQAADLAVPDGYPLVWLEAQGISDEAAGRWAGVDGTVLRKHGGQRVPAFFLWGCAGSCGRVGCAICAALPGTARGGGDLSAVPCADGGRG